MCYKHAAPNGAKMSATKLIQLNSEVQAALTANQPVVALESTVIAHG